MSKTATTLTVLIAAAVPLSLTAGPATAATPTKCGNVETANGGMARNVSAMKLSCRSARAIARRANGRVYKASGLTCAPLGGAYACTKAHSRKRLIFIYRAP